MGAPEGFLAIDDPELDAHVVAACGRKGAVGDAWLERPVTGIHEKPAPARHWQGENEAVVERRDVATTPEAAWWTGWSTCLTWAYQPYMAIKRNERLAVGYVRCSKEEQTLTPEAQRAAIQSFCDHEGLTLVAVHEDLADGALAAALLESAPGP